MFCKNCGKEVAADASFCPHCGVALAMAPGIPMTKSKVIAGLLAIFLGYLGIHKFYLDYTKEGVITLVIFLASFPLLFLCGAGYLTAISIYIITFIEGILYLAKSDADFERTYVQGRRGWF
jgi:TM2 domain-containing membrane protein YozV